MREGVLEQVCGIIPQELSVGRGIRECLRIIQGLNDDIGLDKLEQSSKQNALQLEPALVIRISEHEEDVLQDTEEVLLEECVGDSWIGCGGKVVDDLKAH